MFHGLDASMSISLSGTAGNLGAIEALVSAASEGAPPAMELLVEGREVF